MTLYLNTEFELVRLCGFNVRFRETGFYGAETAASKRSVTFNRSLAETKPPHENPPIRRHLRETGKSLFVCDCVVDLRGLELRANHVVAVEPISGL
jgi:hypothetical protein